MKRFLKNKRGQIRVIEAFFAAVLMLSSLTLIPLIQSRSSNSGSDLTSVAINTLTSLDGDGSLTCLVDERDWSGLKDLLGSVVPVALWFNVSVFDEDLALLNNVSICRGGPVGGDVEAVDYLCASLNGTYALYTIRLQLGGLS